jgi:queuine tRNA-ribosyltransferase
MTDAFGFTLHSIDGQARRGTVHTLHGDIRTPAFMPVGTVGTVKALYLEQVRDAGADIILGNVYHLMLRPGAERVARLGGLHRFIGWDGPILTDSGGFQVFSLGDLRSVNDEKAVFKSHIDGSILELSPEAAIDIQEKLGADCIMCLDECPPLPSSREKLIEAVDRTTAWAARCRDAQTRSDQALLGIVQGGTDAALRQRSAEGLLPLDFPGYAVGGLSVGEEPVDMYRTLDDTVPMLPADKPRYLMGVGRPIDIIEAVLRGIDLFDCVMPTRNARNAMAFTSVGNVKMRNLAHQRDESPLDPGCDCPTCTQFSRGYLRHLFIAGEMLGPMLLSVHNLAHYQRLVRELRTAILQDRGPEFREQYLASQRGDQTND